MGHRHKGEKVSCPPPLKPRDFVLQRSWLDTGPQGEQMLLSRSVPHKNYPPKKGYVRAMSYITGFVLRTNKNSKTGCILKYVAHCDPQGTLPPWLVNKVTHTLGPRMVKDLKKAALGYAGWKQTQPHLRKPWRFPEEIRCPRISIEDVRKSLLSNGKLQGSPKTVQQQQQTTTEPQQQTPTQRKLPQLKTQTNGRVLPILHKKAQSTPASPVVEEAKFLKRDDLKEKLDEKRKDEKKKQKDSKEAKAKDGKESLKSTKELEKEAKAAAKESKKLSKAAAKEAAAAESAVAKKEKKEKGLTKRRSLLNLKF
uniref:START domain-containing protein n=1 Tax=Anopheles funestus TaxID=62324 RepID=A0A182RMC5_ANOFN